MLGAVSLLRVFMLACILFGTSGSAAISAAFAKTLSVMSLGSSYRPLVSDNRLDRSDELLWCQRRTSEDSPVTLVTCYSSALRAYARLADRHGLSKADDII